MRKKLLVSIAALIPLLLVSSLVLSNLFLKVQSNPNEQTDSSSTFDVFLKIDGILGESQDATHKDWIEILSYWWGENQTGLGRFAGGGAAAGRVTMGDFHFVMLLNKASPKLFLAVASGQHIKSAELDVRRAGGEQEFLKWTFTDVLITSYHTSGSTNAYPIDQFTISFGKTEVEYRQTLPDGILGPLIKASWDLRTNRGG